MRKSKGGNLEFQRRCKARLLKDSSRQIIWTYIPDVGVQMQGNTLTQIEAEKTDSPLQHWGAHQSKQSAVYTAAQRRRQETIFVAHSSNQCRVIHGTQETSFQIVVPSLFLLETFLRRVSLHVGCLQTIRADMIQVVRGRCSRLRE